MKQKYISSIKKKITMFQLAVSEDPTSTNSTPQKYNRISLQHT